ncbi:sensor domain-containing protein [Mycobacterium hubeiense]|uniref:sensor domain-containing protein n=1 Tax=Mycobacterium hubeiense TaxID=1867256 RepID=UPI0013046A1F|nr:sensor domain-containing protein [Mycobacterium sp. QGD 101]
MRRLSPLGAALSAALVLAGCTSVTGGQAVSIHQPQHSEPPMPAPATTLVTADALGDWRLKRSELGAIVSDTDMRQVKSYTSPDESGEGIEPRACAYTILFQGTIPYGASQATVGDANRGARGQSVSQLISVFADPELSARVVADAARLWDKCPAGQPFSTTSGSTTQHWVRETTTVVDGRATTTITRQEQPPRSCGHVVAAQSNVAVEAIVCGDGDSTAQADEVVTRIVRRLPG